MWLSFVYIRHSIRHSCGSDFSVVLFIYWPCNKFFCSRCCVARMCHRKLGVLFCVCGVCAFMFGYEYIVHNVVHICYAAQTLCPPCPFSVRVFCSRTFIKKKYNIPIFYRIRRRADNNEPQRRNTNVYTTRTPKCFGQNTMYHIYIYIYMLCITTTIILYKVLPRLTKI